MIAAVYARKSTDQNVADESKSVTRQVEHARAYAAQKGWTVDDAHVYVDDGISGAEFAGRPAYMRMLASLQPRAPFQVLIMSESSRLGREALETGYALKQLLVAGVRVFFTSRTGSAHSIRRPTSSNSRSSRRSTSSNGHARVSGRRTRRYSWREPAM